MFHVKQCLLSRRVFHNHQIAPANPIESKLIRTLAPEGECFTRNIRLQVYKPCFAAFNSTYHVQTRLSKKRYVLIACI